MYLLLYSLLLTSLVSGQCPYVKAGLGHGSPESPHRRQTRDPERDGSNGGLEQFYVSDENVQLTSDSGTRIGDQDSLKAGDRGPTLLEDFIFREKIMRFDHERVPERAVHARGAAAHGTFESYADWSNITGASFLNTTGKQTPIFLRFSTVAGSRGSADSVRDVHGYAIRFYTDEGNFDIVGNSIPVFFIQDAIRFPDLIHAVKPEPDSEIPQAATAHDNAWDFFGQQPSTLHTLLWAMSPHGIPRSYRHLDGFGVHTYRFVRDDGNSTLVKFHFKTLQGKASLVWEEAQVLAGMNADYHRDDLFRAIETDNFPQWEFSVQVINEADALSYGFDLLDSTKLLPEELVPLTPLGKLTLNRNPVNYFAETEQVMFQPGHVVRGIDFTDDPLLQGRIFSYLDTQLNRHGGPNFEQLPINRPRVQVHNNHRDGAAQNLIHQNKHPYTPNSFGGPLQSTRFQGRGFFTAPSRQVSGSLNRELSETYDDVWSQPRLFFNSLEPVEKQSVVNAIRFELAQVSSSIREQAIVQLNLVSNELASQVTQALGLSVPLPNSTYYHSNASAAFSVTRQPLLKIDGLRVGVLIDTQDQSSLAQASELRSRFAMDNITMITIGQVLVNGINQTYSTASAATLDGIVVTPGVARLLTSDTTGSLYPAGRPANIVSDAYRWGKPIGALSSNAAVFNGTSVMQVPGVFLTDNAGELVDDFKEGLRTFRFTSRFVVDPVFQ